MRKLEDQKTRGPEDHWAEETSLPLCPSAPLLPCGGRGGWGHPLCSSAGYVLPLVLIIALLLTISGTAFLTMYTGESKNITARIDEQKALYFAEAGIRKAIWRMNQRTMGEWEQWATFSESNISVTYVDSTKTLTSVGNGEGKVDTIRVEVFLDTAANHVVSYTGSFTSLGGSGYLDAPEGNMPAQFDSLPIVDLNYYLSIANFIYGQPDSTVTQTFADSLTDGIHFIYGDVNVKNNTVLNGTIVVTGDIRFSGTNNISAQQVPADSSYYPAYYPAVISCGDSLNTQSGGSPNLDINGMLYSTGMCDFNPCDVNGPIIAANIELQGSYTVTYDEKYSLRPPGFSWPEGSFVATVGSWSN